MKNTDTSIGAMLCEKLNEETKMRPKLKDSPHWVVNKFIQENKIDRDNYEINFYSGLLNKKRRHLSVFIQKRHYSFEYKASWPKFCPFLFYKWQLIPRTEEE